MQLIDILSKPVISLYNGTNEGVVLSACFSEDLKKLNYFIVVSSTDNEDDELVLSSKEVYKFGNDAIMIKNNSCLELRTNFDGVCFNNPINSMAYDMDGNLLGKVTSVSLDEQLSIDEFIVGDKFYKRSQLVSFSFDTLVFKNMDVKVSLSKFRPNTTFISGKVDTPVKIMQIGTIKQETDGYDRNQISRLTLNANLLLGRKTTKNILARNGELIAKSGLTISSKIITMARTHQKLRELAIYSE